MPGTAGRLVKKLFRYRPDRRVGAAFASLRLVCFLDIFQTTLDTIPSEVPYLRPRHLVQRTPGKPLRVGLVWAGNPKQQRDRMRSCPFEELLPLFETEGIHWVCLQREIPLSDRGPAEICKHLERLSLDDFTATANQISGLDLVISVDTSVAHLAGALNVPGLDPAGQGKRLAMAVGSRRQSVVPKREAVPTTTGGRLEGSCSSR